jgi:hypothetical protein
MTTSYYIYLMINQVLIGYLLAALASSRAEEQVKQSLNQRKGSWPAH